MGNKQPAQGNVTSAKVKGGALEGVGCAQADLGQAAGARRRKDLEFGGAVTVTLQGGKDYAGPAKFKKTKIPMACEPL